eukprot:NODE_4849_length_634_cov_318.291883.p1 GENE.NODE_4849_length_634_cov_318.291883~~NODE_4849_length_634_cov_318.291883.p1  ORF type:complete len:149 (-),score=53.70 NODE_4849_length_634_cov_318.291883:142-588(-)
MKYSDVLFTQGLVVARASEERGYAWLPEAQRTTVSLVTAAAPNIRFASEISARELLMNTMQSIFVAPAQKQPEVTTLILGAFGCGAFGGDPAEISALFVDAIKGRKLGRLYREVHFAIPKLPDATNAEAFRTTFRNEKVAFKELAIEP